MSEDIPYNRTATTPAGALAQLSPRVARLVAPNAGPFTFTGTCTYIVGTDCVAVIDPGPEDAKHHAALMTALAGRAVSAILVSHTHRDHSPGAVALKAATGAPILGCALHWAARELALGEINALDASADRSYQPDHVLADGETVEGAGWTLTAVETPGHTMNHLCFAMAEEKALFSADHVMGWSTSIVAPPDGSMRAYMASLDRLKARDETIYWPGHGGPVTEPGHFVRALITHRRMREQSVVNALAAGIETIPDMVSRIYVNLDQRLKGAAALSCFAHLEDLVDRDLARCDTPAPTLKSRYSPR